MQAWLPVPGTTTGRLVEAALELFGRDSFGQVNVAEIARRAGVTTGSLYHHFGSKAGLYRLVRADVERRVIDRMEGAAAGRRIDRMADLAPVLVVGFDYLVSRSYLRLLAEPMPTESTDVVADPIEELLDRLLGHPRAPTAVLLAAAWRAALTQAGRFSESADDARSALISILAGSGSPERRLLDQ